MKPRFFAPRLMPRFAPKSLFFTIFLWFFGAQLLIGIALYLLAAATERRLDRGTAEMAGGYLEARAKAAAVAFELGGREAAREAWRLPSLPDGPRGRRSPEDRASASLFEVREGGTQLLAGPNPDVDTARLESAARQSAATIESENGATWLTRRIETDTGIYLALIRLRGRGGPPGRPRGVWDGLLGGRPGPSFGGPLWGGILRWLVIVATMGAVCFALARYLTLPALQISRAARRFAAGEFGVRVGPELGTRRDELAELGRDFDFMAERIETQRAGERRLLGDISHELRSPLARMKVALDLAEQGADADTRSYLLRVEEEVEELGTLIGQLLTLTRLENAGNSAPSDAIVDLSALVADVCADADFEASASNRTVELRENQPALVNGHESLLRSAIENVVRNALLHAPNSPTVQVSLQTSETEAIVRVRDHGPGVPEAELEKLFEPFYRVAQARDRQSGGTGLGLSITQRALASHGGSVRAINANGGGLEIEIRLPLAQR